jgi:hypothetical protein
MAQFELTYLHIQLSTRSIRRRNSGPGAVLISRTLQASI